MAPAALPHPTPAPRPVPHPEAAATPHPARGGTQVAHGGSARHQADPGRLPDRARNGGFATSSGAAKERGHPAAGRPARHSGPRLAAWLWLALACLLPPWAGAEPAGDIDARLVTVGLQPRKPITTARIQAMRGACRVTLSPLPAASGTEPVLSEEKTCKLAEDEDLSLQVTHRGIMVRTSEGIEFKEGFGKLVVVGDGLFNLEMFNLPPSLLSGRLEVTLQDDNTVSFVNQLSIGELVKAAVSEFSPSPEIEATKAFIVLARTRILAACEQRRHASDTFDLCAGPHCLTFTGYGNNRELVEVLFDQVPNLVMAAGGRVVFPYFQECCGGKISSAKDIFGKDDPVHQAREDRIPGKGSENCFHSPSFYWTREFSQEEMADFLSITFAGGSSRVFLRWDPVKTDAAGRITEVRLYGRRDQKMLGTDFLEAAWDYFGANSLKSMRFTLEPMRRATIFRGMGRGQGVGLCLYGADGLAKKGMKFEEILRFYYTGITLTTNPGGVAAERAPPAPTDGRPKSDPGRNGGKAGKPAKPGKVSR